MDIFLEKFAEIYRTDAVIMFQINMLIAFITYLAIGIYEDKKNHIAKQLGKKLKRIKKKRSIKLEIDLDEGIFSQLAKRIEKKAEQKLENANINFEPKEYAFTFIFGMIAGGLIGFIFLPFIFHNLLSLMFGNVLTFVFSRLMSTILFAAIGTLVPLIIVKVKIKRRQKALSDQLIDFIMSLADGLKASSTPQEAIKVIAKELPSPISDELAKVVAELEFSVPFEDALEGMKRRIDLPEYTLVINAMQIQARTGSHLGEMMRNMARVSEERRDTKDEVLKIVRQTKTTAYILLAAPFALGGGMFLMMPDMAIPAYKSFVGMLVLAAFAVIYVITIFIIKKIDKYVEKSL